MDVLLSKSPHVSPPEKSCSWKPNWFTTFLSKNLIEACTLKLLENSFHDNFICTWVFLCSVLFKQQQQQIFLKIAMCIVQLCSGRDLPGASFTRTSVARPSTTTPSLRAILPKIIKEKTQSGAIRKESLSFSLEGILFTDLLQVKAAYCTSVIFFLTKSGPAWKVLWQE